MNSMLKNYIAKLNKEQIISFALMHNIVLNDEEVNFTYSFIKNNWEELFKYYTKENFPKIKVLFQEYYEKFKPFFN